MSQRGLVPAGSGSGTGHQVLLAQQRTLEQRTSASSTTVRESHSRGQETRVSQQTFTSQQHQTSSTHRGKLPYRQPMCLSPAHLGAVPAPFIRARVQSSFPRRFMRDFRKVCPSIEMLSSEIRGFESVERRSEKEREREKLNECELEYFWGPALARPEIDARARREAAAGYVKKKSPAKTDIGQSV